MMKRLALAVTLFLTVVTLPIGAQITIPNTLVSGTTITASGLNANFTALGTSALNRGAGTMTGTLTSQAILPTANDTYDLGTTGTRFQDLYLSATLNTGTAVLSEAAGLTIGGVNIIASTGKIPALTATYFTSVDGGQISNLSAAAINTGTVFGAVSAVNLINLTAANLTGTIAAAVQGNITRTGTVTVGTWGSLLGATTGSTVQGQATTSGISLGVLGGNFGAGAVSGASISVGRNGSGNGAPGMVQLRVRDNSNDNYIWSDTTGVMRANLAVAPTETTGDLVGTVIGTQVSTLDTKDLLGGDLTPEQALATLLDTPVVRFRYKSKAYSGSTFQGIIADWSPEFAMDPSPEHPDGRSFNPISAFGYTVQSVKALHQEVETLKQEVAALRAAAKP